MTPEEEAEAWFNSLYICDDPDCTATHVNIEDIVPLQFTEEISDESSG